MQIVGEDNPITKIIVIAATQGVRGIQGPPGPPGPQGPAGNDVIQTDLNGGYF